MTLKANHVAREKKPGYSIAKAMTPKTADIARSVSWNERTRNPPAANMHSMKMLPARDASLRKIMVTVRVI